MAAGKGWMDAFDEITYNAFEKVCSMYGIPIKAQPASNLNYLGFQRN